MLIFFLLLFTETMTLSASFSVTSRPMMKRDASSALTSSSTLSMILDNVPEAKVPLKIAVAGAGIGGVFTGYALQEKGFDVTVFEKASKFSRFGGPIQLG